MRCKVLFLFSFLIFHGAMQAMDTLSGEQYGKVVVVTAVALLSVYSLYKGCNKFFDNKRTLTETLSIPVDKSLFEDEDENKNRDFLKRTFSSNIQEFVGTAVNPHSWTYQSPHIPHITFSVCTKVPQLPTVRYALQGLCYLTVGGFGLWSSWNLSSLV